MKLRRGGLVVATGVVAATITSTSVDASSGLAVHGSVAGTYSALNTNPDMGHRYHITSAGTTSLGSTRASGQVQGPGNTHSGYCTARLVFTTSKGSITAAVKSQKTFGSFAACQSGFGFDWRSIGETGRYTGHAVSGTGSLTLVKPGNASTNPPPGYVTLDR